MNSSLSLALLAGLILLNGLLAMAEIAMISARKNRLKSMAKDGDRAAKIALDLAESPNRFLSTIQIGITLIGLLSGAIGAAPLASKMSNWLQTSVIPLPDNVADGIGMAVVALVLTYVSLVFGELAPKRIGMAFPENIARWLARPMQKLALVANPLVQALSASTEATLKILRIPEPKSDVVSEEEIKALIDQGVTSGVFQKIEHEIVDRAFRLDEMDVETLMTPRPKVIWLDVNDSDSVLREKILASGYIQFPLCDGAKDNVIGIISLKSIWASNPPMTQGKLRRMASKPMFVPGVMKAGKLLELMKYEKREMILVTDEFGSVQGLLTPQDLLEGIVGRFAESERGQPKKMTRRSDGTWLCDGMLGIAEFKEHFDLKNLHDEKTADYQTLAGYLLHLFGRIPQEGEHVETDELRLEIVDMDRNRIDKALITPHKQLESAIAELDRGSEI